MFRVLTSNIERRADGLAVTDSRPAHVAGTSAAEGSDVTGPPMAATAALAVTLAVAAFVPVAVL